MESGNEATGSAQKLSGHGKNLVRGSIAIKTGELNHDYLNETPVKALGKSRWT